jgi:MYXO-CTERM domain-containing protein
VAQIPTGPSPLYNDLGWFNASPPNLQGRVGTAPNTATQVKLGQFMLSANDTAFRTYTLRIAVNNASASTPVFSDGSFTLGAIPAPGAIALLGLAGLTGRRRR